MDLGSVDRLPPGSDAILEAPGIFVLRTSDGMITAFSRRAPKEGCRIALAFELAPSLDDRLVFHDPCHGQNFDRDGRPAGGPGIRGMYRYDVLAAIVNAEPATTIAAHVVRTRAVRRVHVRVTNWVAVAGDLGSCSATEVPGLPPAVGAKHILRDQDLVHLVRPVGDAQRASAEVHGREG